MTALTHSDVSKVSNADVKLCNDVTKCPIAPLIQLQQVAHSQPVRRRGIPRQPLPSLVAGSNQHRSSSLTSVTVQVCRVSQCTPWRHTTCCSSRWPSASAKSQNTPASAAGRRLSEQATPSRSSVRGDCRALPDAHLSNREGEPAGLP